MKSEVVLRVGAEGGSLSLLRCAEEPEETFVVHLCETDYDQDELESVDEVIGETDSLIEALEVMDRYSWSRLAILQLSTDWEAQIFAAVEEREGSEQVSRWRRRLAFLRTQRED